MNPFHYGKSKFSIWNAIKWHLQVISLCLSNQLWNLFWDKSKIALGGRFKRNRKFVCVFSSILLKFNQILRFNSGLLKILCFFIIIWGITKTKKGSVRIWIGNVEAMNCIMDLTWWKNMNFKCHRMDCAQSYTYVNFI